MPSIRNLHRDPWDQLVLTDSDGRRYVGVEVVQAFPMSDPGHAISLCDAEGHEILHVAELEGQRPEIRQLLEEELMQRQFMPIIEQIVGVSGDAEPCEWHVETDRGATTFELDSEDEVRLLDLHQATIVDAHGIRYLIPDIRRLDAGSRRILDRYL